MSILQSRRQYSLTDLLKKVYPIGSLYLSVNSTNPATSLGFGTWTAFGAGQVPVGFLTADPNFGTDEATGGEVTHTLTAAEIPTAVLTSASGVNTRRTDGASNLSGGGGGAHNNLQPFIVVRMWKRTA